MIKLFHDPWIFSALCLLVFGGLIILGKELSKRRNNKQKPKEKTPEQVPPASEKRILSFDECFLLDENLNNLWEIMRCLCNLYFVNGPRLPDNYSYVISRQTKCLKYRYMYLDHLNEKAFGDELLRQAREAQQCWFELRDMHYQDVHFQRDERVAEFAFNNLKDYEKLILATITRCEEYGVENLVKQGLLVEKRPKITNG